MPTPPFTGDQLRERYGSFYKRRRKLEAPNVLPSALQALVPYAEVWGEGDDYAREELVDTAPDVAKEDLLALFSDRALYRRTVDWLAETADTLLHTDAYRAVSCLLLAFDSIKALRDWEADQKVVD